MQFKFSNRSKSNLQECHFSLQLIIREALSYGIMDFTIIEGHRPKDLQEKYFREGKSKVHYPNGKHNKVPSEAVDIVPYIDGKINWEKEHCCVLAGIVLSASSKLEIPIRWGGAWSGEINLPNNSFQDLCHFELILK